MDFLNDIRKDNIIVEDKLCKHLDGDLTYCLMIKSKCVGKEYCRDFEEREEESADYQEALLIIEAKTMLLPERRHLRALYRKLKELENEKGV